MAGRPATINDVAAAAGVSRQTVTRAVNDMPGINASTRQRVLAAARKLHYRPSRFGRGLVKPDSRTLGLLIEDLGNPYYAELASEVLGLAAAAGWNVIIGERAHAADPAEFLIDEFARQVDAVISFTHLGVATSRDGLPDLPLVQIDPQSVSPAEHGRIELDRRRAVTAAVRHLTGAGVQRPVVFDRAQPSPRADEFLRAFAAAGVPARRIPSGSTDLAGGLDATRLLLREDPHVDAIVAYNDVMAIGVLRALRSAGIDVPGRIRVVGVDGLQISRFISPRLTTLAIDMPAVAQAALGLVMTMQDPAAAMTASSLRQRVSYRLDIGEST